ncbi:MAG: ABC transporter ATP-binding protein [Planctomycetes bacterium]|nr:ABC transporter ATP-binding protein [Planctomycetota bacterium]
MSFRSERGAPFRAVDGVGLTIHPAQTLAVVGESGSGKSVTAMSVNRLNPSPPAVYERGRVLFSRRDGSTTDVLNLGEKQMRSLRGGEIAMIFQEPMTSLNPVYTVGEQIVEAVLLHQRVGVAEAEAIAAKALADVGISDAARRMRSYPHEFSGGMRQRVMIAMALSCRPRLLLADEPTTALDVTIQAQVLDLLTELKRSRSLAIMLITHAMGVVAEAADVACVMYAGRVVEYASVPDLFDCPLHPYTRALLRCIPDVSERRPRLATVRKLLEDPAEFSRASDAIGDGLVPWWPTHRAPSGSENASAIVEVRPGRYVGVWRTPAAAARAVVRPDIAFRHAPVGAV